MKRIGLALALSVILALTTSNVAATAGIDNLTNQYRVANGLSALTTSPSLQAVVNRRAQEIATDFNHPSDWGPIFAQLPSCFQALGEIIAWYSPPDSAPADWPVGAWAKSDSHRHNLLGDWDFQASATIISGTRIYAAQLFGRGCTSTVAPPPAPPRPQQPEPAPTAPSAPPALLVLPNTSIR